MFRGMGCLKLLGFLSQTTTERYNVHRRINNRKEENKDNVSSALSGCTLTSIRISDHQSNQVFECSSRELVKKKTTTATTKKTLLGSRI